MLERTGLVGGMSGGARGMCVDLERRGGGEKEEVGRGCGWEAEDEVTRVVVVAAVLLVEVAEEEEAGGEAESEVDDGRVVSLPSFVVWGSGR